MVTKTERCAFTEFRIVPGRGSRFIGKDGRTIHLIGSKARSLFHQKIKPVKLTWTTAWRQFNKKVKVDDSTKKRARKTTKVQKAVVGMSLDEIKRKKAETREDRDKKTDVREKEVKDRKMKAMKEKKDAKAKQQKAAGGAGAKKEKIKDKGAPAGGKQKNVGVRK